MTSLSSKTPAEIVRNASLNQHVFFEIEIDGKTEGVIVFELFYDIVPITCKSRKRFFVRFIFFKKNVSI